MIKHTQTIRLLPTNCLSVFGHFVGLSLKGLIADFACQLNENIAKAAKMYEDAECRVGKFDDLPTKVFRVGNSTGSAECI